MKQELVAWEKEEEEASKKDKEGQEIDELRTKSTPEKVYSYVTHYLRIQSFQ